MVAITGTGGHWPYFLNWLGGMSSSFRTTVVAEGGCSGAPRLPYWKSEKQ
jgi:hypothetical protein